MRYSKMWSWMSAGIVGACLFTASAVQAQEALKIGAPVSISGRYVAYGSQAKNGIETGVEMWRKVRGDKIAGRPIEVILRDTQSNNAITVSIMNELIQTEDVDVIIGPDGSNVAAAAVPPWKKLEDRPIWFMAGGSSDVIEQEVGDDPYFFHTYAWAYYYHVNLVNALKEFTGDKNKVALLYSDGAYGRAHVEHARKYIEEGGFEIVVDELIREGSPDFNSALVRVRAAQPDILYVLVQTNDAIQIAKQIAAAQLDVSYLVGTAQAQLPEWQEAVGSAQDCWFGVTTWVPGLNYPADEREPELFPSAADWEVMWQEKYNEVPEFLEVGFYNSTILALLAVEATESVDRDDLTGWLEQQDYQTPLGRSKFEKSQIAQHQAFGTMVVFQRQEQGSEFGAALLYPPEVATGEAQTCNQ